MSALDRTPGQETQLTAAEPAVLMNDVTITLTTAEARALYDAGLSASRSNEPASSALVKLAAALGEKPSTERIRALAGAKRALEAGDQVALFAVRQAFVDIAAAAAEAAEHLPAPMKYRP